MGSQNGCRLWEGESWAEPCSVRSPTGRPHGGHLWDVLEVTKYGSWRLEPAPLFFLLVTFYGECRVAWCVVALEWLADTQ